MSLGKRLLRLICVERTLKLNVFINTCHITSQIDTKFKLGWRDIQPLMMCNGYTIMIVIDNKISNLISIISKV